MPILRPKEIRKMSPKDRQKRLAALRTELLNQRAKIATGGAVESPGRIREIKETISRILTIEHEVKLGINQE
ncbi:MAG: 50S ribosomal protein L29 [Promethearchaeota archaeon]